MLLLDQRGTGRSTPVGPIIPGDTAEAQAAYLTLFRADSIVRDAEWIRQELGVDRWSVLGQSFGGFTSMTYLSIAPEGLREAFITGGLSPIGRPVDDIYGATYRRLMRSNRRYFERYPEDRARAAEHVPPARRRGRPPSDRRTTDGSPVPPARAVARRQRGLRAPAPRHRAAVRISRVSARRRSRGPLRPQPDLRDPARVLVRRRRGDALVGPPAAPREVEQQGFFTAEHVFPVDVGGLRGACGRSEPPPISWPSIHGRRCTTRTGFAATRSRSRPRSMSTTCTSSVTSRRRRRPRSAGCVPGRPTNSSTTGCEPMESASLVD